VHFFDAYGLTGKDLAEVDFLASQADAIAVVQKLSRKESRRRRGFNP